MEDVELYIEAYRQVAFVSAVLGGFAATFLGVLLTHRDERRLSEWTVGAALTASILLIVATFLDSFLVFSLPGLGARSVSELPAEVHSVASMAVFAFYGGIFALLASLALAGWMRSRTLGLVGTFLALGAAFAILRSAFLLGRAFGG